VIYELCLTPLVRCIHIEGFAFNSDRRCCSISRVVEIRIVGPVLFKHPV
jgi:hypothetical protein